MFHEEKLNMLRQDITCLLKAAGITTDPESDRTKTIVQCLDIFAVGTDQPKPPPKAPDPHDLGLFREKCCYMSATKKAEKSISHDCKDDVIDVNKPSGEAVSAVDYSLGQQCIDALLLVFDEPELSKLVHTKDNSSVPRFPIGFQLLRE